MKQISSFMKDLKPVSTMDKKQNAIKLLGSESSNTSDSKDSINLDDISDEPVLFDI